MKKEDRMRAIVGTLVAKLQSAVLLDPAPPFDTDEIQNALWSDQQEYAKTLKRQFNLQD